MMSLAFFHERFEKLSVVPAASAVSGPAEWSVPGFFGSSCPPTTLSLDSGLDTSLVQVQLSAEAHEQMPCAALMPRPG